MNGHADARFRGLEHNVTDIPGPTKRDKEIENLEIRKKMLT